MTSLSVPTVLSFVAAFGDVVCYIGIFITFVAFVILATRLSPLPGPDSWQTVTLTGLAVFAMALQTTAMAMLPHFHTPTTMMTGNTTTLIVQVWNAGSAARYWAGNPPKLPRSALNRRYAAAVLGFLSGGIAGAVG